MTRRRRFAVRLLVVATIIAALVGIGLLWRLSPLASVVAKADDHHLGGGTVRAGEGGLIHLRRIGNLVGSTVIGAAVMAAVIAVDKARRRQQPVRRAVRPTPTVVREMSVSTS